ncbi:MAG: Hpt domain-containing protein, partial [Actinobacteria bacterium]|nr:Hpt domain-containing protein [Actinomycetota bacterium]
AMDRGDALTVSQAAHKLKGSSATIGAARVAHIAGALATTAPASDLSGAEELLDRLSRALAQTEEALTSSAPRASERGEAADERDAVTL